MEISKIMKEAMAKHQKKVEIIQWAIISGVTSLVYSEFISKIKQKAVPVPMVQVPEIRSIQYLLEPNGQFVDLLSKDLIDYMLSSKYFQEFLHAPELELFRTENVEILKTIFDMYISPNIHRRVPETIMIKFGLNNTEQQFVRQSNEIYMFDNRPINEGHVEFIADQCILQLLVLMPTMIKDIEIPEENFNLLMAEDEILTINHEKAICPIHFNKDIIDNKTVIELLKFVTSTQIHEFAEDAENHAIKNEKRVAYNINTNPFNTVSFTRLMGIETESSID